MPRVQAGAPAEEELPKKKSAAPYFVVAGGVGGGGGGGGGLGGEGAADDADDATPTVTPTPTPTPTPSRLRRRLRRRRREVVAPVMEEVIVDSVPPGGEDFCRGCGDGDTPEAIKVEKGKTKSVVLKKDGFVDKEETVDPGKNKKLLVRLEKVKKAVAVKGGKVGKLPAPPPASMNPPVKPAAVVTAPPAKRETPPAQPPRKKRVVDPYERVDENPGKKTNDVLNPYRWPRRRFMRGRSLVASLTLLSFTTLILWPHGAWAQGEAKPAEAPPRRRRRRQRGNDDAAMAQAKTHFETGRNAYNAGDYVTAIREFKAAEQLRPSPILDYNIGLANEKLGKRRVAVKYYKRYLELQPNAANKAEVEGKVAVARGGDRGAAGAAAGRNGAAAGRADRDAGRHAAGRSERAAGRGGAAGLRSLFVDGTAGPAGGGQARPRRRACGGSASSSAAPSRSPSSSPWSFGSTPSTRRRTTPTTRSPDRDRRQRSPTASTATISAASHFSASKVALTQRSQ